MMTGQTARSWEMYAHLHDGKLWHLGDRRNVESLVLPDPILSVTVVEWLGDPDDPQVTHYGWEDAGRPDIIEMIWPRAEVREVSRGRLRPHALLDMCFPYGVDEASRAGQGKMVSLVVRCDHE